MKLFEEDPTNAGSALSPAQIGSLSCKVRLFMIIPWTAECFFFLHFVEGFLAALGRLLCGASVTWSRIFFTSAINYLI